MCATARWHSLVLALLNVKTQAGVTHKVFKDGWECHYSDRGYLTPEVQWRHGLNDWLEVLDTVGNEMIQQQGLTWEPWEGPALAVPEHIVLTDDFTDKLLAFRQQLTTEEHVILTLGLEVSTLNEVAQMINRPIGQIQAAWQHMWEQFAMATQPLINGSDIKSRERQR